MFRRYCFLSIISLALCTSANGFSSTSRFGLPGRHLTHSTNDPPIAADIGHGSSECALSAVNKKNGGSGDSGEPSSTYYSDDCFGLIFLSTGLVAGDVIFASCFALISGLAATYFNNNSKELDGKLQKQFPAAAAGLTLLFAAPVSRVVLQPNSLDFLPERAPFSTMLEIGVCAFSVIYSLVMTSRKEA